MIRTSGFFTATLLIAFLFSALFFGGTAAATVAAAAPGSEEPAVPAPAGVEQPPDGETGTDLGDEPGGQAGPAYCRAGVDLYKRLLVQEFDLRSLHTGWYVDYYGPGSAHAVGMDYAPVISMRQVGTDGYRLDRPWSKIDTLLSANPGAIWLIGNEPDRVIVQDDMEPQAYAAGYHDLYNYIKARDPLAQVVAGSIVQASPLRLQYLDMVLDAYHTRYGAPLPADGWSIHGYLLNERSCAAFPEDCWGAEIPPGITATQGLVLSVADAARLDLFAAQIERFRRWMADRGYRDRPFYVTEFGVLLPPSVGYSPEVVNRFMHGAFDYMLEAKDPQTGYARDGGRLVQRFAWYGTLTPNANGALYESVNATTPISPPFTLSTIGLGYQDYTIDLTPTVDIAIAETALTPSIPPTAHSAGGSNPGVDTGFATGYAITSAAIASAGLPSSGTEFTATLVLTVTNAGNLTEETHVLVSIYDGPPSGGGEQLAPAQTVALGGCGGAQSVQFVWRSPPEGPRRGFLTVVATWAGGSLTQRLAYFVPQHFVFVPLVTK